MTITCSGCPAKWGSPVWAHCSGCHATFTALAHFDAHRSGKLPPTGPTYSMCWNGWRVDWFSNSVGEVGRAVFTTNKDNMLVLLNEDGVWSTEEGHIHRRDLVERAAIARAARGK